MSDSNLVRNEHPSISASNAFDWDGFNEFITVIHDKVTSELDSLSMTHDSLIRFVVRSLFHLRDADLYVLFDLIDMTAIDILHTLNFEWCLTFEYSNVEPHSKLRVCNMSMAVISIKSNRT
jgi:hypothetical protein